VRRATNERADLDLRHFLALAAQAVAAFPALNVLINNAGLQRIDAPAAEIDDARSSRRKAAAGTRSCRCRIISRDGRRDFQPVVRRLLRAAEARSAPKARS
jgi:NAD(P)-dependent dehydrogenase (short-subunit alcohol dehydrogenase family)